MNVGVMTAGKASFFAKDPSPTTNHGGKTTGKNYMGVERRRSNRRTVEDRREEIRFDLSKEERRKAAGRREHDSDPRFW